MYFIGAGFWTLESLWSLWVYKWVLAGVWLGLCCAAAERCHAMHTFRCLGTAPHAMSGLSLSTGLQRAWCAADLLPPAPQQPFQAASARALYRRLVYRAFRGQGMNAAQIKREAAGRAASAAV